MAEAVKTRRRRRADPNEAERRELKDFMARTRVEINQAYAGFNLQTDPDLVDSYVYEINSLQSRYSYLVRRLKALDIHVIAHMILGLPGETPEMMVQTARYIGQSGADGIKLHLLHVLSGTDLAEDYAAGNFETMTLDAYLSVLEDCLRVLPRELVIHRMTGDGAKRSLIAPMWSADKKRVLNALNRRFLSDDLEQGSALLL